MDGKAYRAVLYIRLSKEDDDEGISQSIEKQKSLLEEYVKNLELYVHDIYMV